MCLASGLAWAGAASAAPVARTADLTLTLEIRNLTAVVITATGATVTVDNTAGTATWLGFSAWEVGP
jgi:hypothetical protein